MDYYRYIGKKFRNHIYGREEWSEIKGSLSPFGCIPQIREQIQNGT